MSNTDSNTSARSVLVVTRALQDPGALVSSLAGIGELREAESVDDALAALRSRRFDLVFCAPTDLFPLARAEARQRAQLILEKIGQGVCIVDCDGRLAWANPKLLSYSDEVVEAIRAQCAYLATEFAGEPLRRETARSRRRAVNVGPDYSFDLTATPLLGAEDEVEQVVGLVWDVTATRRLQDKINAIDSAGRELVRLDAEASAEMDVGERLQLLENTIIRYCRELLHFNHFVVRVLDRKTKKLDPVIADGLSEEAMSIDLYSGTEGGGISGWVAATGRSYICPDVAKDPRYVPGLDGAGSSLTVPLRLHDQVVGILNVESRETGVFTEDDRQFAEIFGRYIAIALHILKLLVVERHTATDQIASDVLAELSAPMNDIVAEATGILEDYIGHDDLRRRLHAIIDRVDQVKQRITSIAEQPAVRGLGGETPSKDPVIGGRRILVADDEEVIRETISETLEQLGAVTRMAADGREAIELLQREPFDLVLSDIKMPQRNGYEVFSVARTEHPSCEVILITGFGYDPSHSIVRAHKEGLAGVLFKPFKVEQLLERVREALGPKQA